MGKHCSNRIFISVYICICTFTAATISGSARSDATNLTLAVTYFDNNSGNNKYDVLRKGIADMIITDLSVSKEIQLIERERLEIVLKEIRLGKSSFIDVKSAQKMGKGLSADLILIGSFSSMTPEMRIDARIVVVETGEVLITATSKGKIEEFYKIESTLSTKLLEGLGEKLTPVQRLKITKPATKKLDAAVAYSRGLDALDRGDEKNAILSFSKALKTDPDFLKAKKQLDEFEKRLTILEKSGGIISNPISADDYLHNASVYESRSEYQKAIAAYEKYFGYKLDFIDPHYRYQGLLKSLRGTDATVAQYKEMKTKYRNNPAFAAAYAILLEEEQKRKECEKLVKKYANYTPVFYICVIPSTDPWDYDNQLYWVKSLYSFGKANGRRPLSSYFVDKTNGKGAEEGWMMALENLKKYNYLEKYKKMAKFPFTIMTTPVGERAWSILLQINSAKRIWYRLGNKGKYILLDEKRMQDIHLENLAPGEYILTLKYETPAGTIKGPYEKIIRLESR